MAGAARYAHQVKTESALTLIDALPLALGVEAMGGVVEFVIERNTPVPCTVTQTFTTAVDYQKFVSITIVQGERDLVEHCVRIGALRIGPITPARAGVSQLDVTFLVDAEGTLSVFVEEKSSGESYYTFVRDVVRVDDKDKVIKESAQHALADAQEVRRVALSHTVWDLERKISILEQQKSVDPCVRTALTQALNVLESNEDNETLEAATEYLEKVILQTYSRD